VSETIRAARECTLPCAVVVGPSVTQYLEQAQSGYFTEVRVDLLSAETQLQLLSGALALPAADTILTYRSRTHGGQGLVNPQLLVALARLQPHWIDIEWEYPDSVCDMVKAIAPDIKIIRSWHGLAHQGPSMLHTTPPGDLWKICPLAPDVSAWIEWEAWYSHCSLPHEKLLYLPQGPWGQLQRLWPERWGLPWVYLPQESFVEGQITLGDYKHIYHEPYLCDHHQMYALLGDPVSRSVGHIIHNRWMSALTFPGRYLKLPLMPQDLSLAWPWIAKNMSGLAITTPLKQAIIPMLDQITGRAQTIGAVNSVKLVDGWSIGDNFDGVGAAKAINQAIRPFGQRVVIIGNGATARACAHELFHSGADVTMLSRAPKKNLAMEGVDDKPLEMWPTYVQDATIVVQATTCGFDNQQLPCDPHLLDGQVVLDVVQGDTPFTRTAAANGCTVIPGREMFIHLSAMQAAWWSDYTVSPADAETLIRKALTS